MTADLRPGALFAGYTLEARLGESGSVYLAGHPRLPRRDALKVFSASDPQARARFLGEAETVARLDHPNIVAVHDRGIEEGLAWVAMRLVDGVDAAALIRRGPAALPVGRVVHIIDQVARGVDAAQAAGVPHRYLEPAKILLESPAGQADRVFVTGFGSPEGPGPAGDPAKAIYIAPEQVIGAPVDGRAAVYALGCILYELLTGTTAFSGNSAAEVLRAHISAPAPRVTTRVPTAPRAVDAVIARALAKDPAQRFASCGALAAAAREALLGAPSDAPAARSSLRRPIALAGAATVAVVLAAATSLLWHSRSGTPESAPPTASAPVTAVPTPPTTTAASTSWGSYKHTVGYFPGLLPQTRDAEGYGGIRCAPVNSAMQPVNVDEQLGNKYWVNCTGKAPVERLTLNCYSVHERYGVQAPTGMRVEGDQKWQRPSGSGRVIWGTYNGTGMLLVDFDRGIRSSCGIEVVGSASGTALYDQWWQSAPL